MLIEVDKDQAVITIPQYITRHIEACDCELCGTPLKAGRQTQLVHFVTCSTCSYKVQILAEVFGVPLGPRRSPSWR